jgi:hypothetical protein
MNSCRHVARMGRSEADIFGGKPEDRKRLGDRYGTGGSRQNWASMSRILLVRVGFQGGFFWSRRCASDSIQRSGQFLDLLREKGLAWGDCVGDKVATSYSLLQGWRTCGKISLAPGMYCCPNSFIIIIIILPGQRLYIMKNMCMHTHIYLHTTHMNYRC